MNPCEYCEKNDKVHVESLLIDTILSQLQPQQRAIIAEFIQYSQDDAYHTTLALERIKQVCTSCGEWKAKEDDGDRYYYTCDNNKCSAF